MGSCAPSTGVPTVTNNVTPIYITIQPKGIQMGVQGHYTVRTINSYLIAQTTVSESLYTPLMDRLDGCSGHTGKVHCPMPHVVTLGDHTGHRGDVLDDWKHNRNHGSL